MRFSQCLEALKTADVTAAYCTRLTPTWLFLHVNLEQENRWALGKRLEKVAGKERRVTVAEDAWV